MSNQRWTEVDNYLNKHLVEQDDALLCALNTNADAGLPAIDVSPNQGKLLHIYARMIQARRVLEIGTLGGYSTIWLARALPEDGKVITLEYDERHAEIASQNIRRAGLEDKITIRPGAALDTLPTLHNSAPFDLIFIDADKKNNPAYLEWALRYSRPGTVIIGDNVVRDGAITHTTPQDENIAGICRFIDLIGQNSRLTATALQTVGSKGWDGFIIALVNH